jgi:DnaJ homolog subfamily C member 28
MPDIDEQIRRAMQEGQFEDLPGRGRPLQLDEDPFEDPDWRLAHHMLRSAGYSLPWIETRREIEADLATHCLEIQRAWERHQSAAVSPDLTRRRWDQAQVNFREAIAELNKRILSYNLEAPSMQLQLQPINPAREIERAMQTGSGYKNGLK